MHRLSTSQLRCEIGQAVSRAEFGKERIIIERRGKPAAAIVPIDDIEMLELAEEMLVEQGMVEEAEERRAAGRPGISLEELKARLGL